MLDSLLQYESRSTEQSAEQTIDERDHDYSHSTPEECILFYLGGYVAHLPSVRTAFSHGDDLGGFLGDDHTVAYIKNGTNRVADVRYVSWFLWR